MINNRIVFAFTILTELGDLKMYAVGGSGNVEEISNVCPSIGE